MLALCAVAVAASLLHDAVRRANATAVLQALSRGASLEERDTLGYTALHRASDDGEVAIVSLLLRSGSALIDARDNDRATALQLAASSGSAAVVKLLLQHHASTDAADAVGDTALHRAAEGGHASVIKLLLAASAATADRRNQDGKTALDVATKWGRAEAAAALGGSVAPQGRSRQIRMPRNMQPSKFPSKKHQRSHLQGRSTTMKRNTAHHKKRRAVAKQPVSKTKPRMGGADVEEAASTIRPVSSSRIGIEEDNLTP